MKKNLLNIIASLSICTLALSISACSSAKNQYLQKPPEPTATQDVRDVLGYDPNYTEAPITEQNGVPLEIISNLMPSAAEYPPDLLDTVHMLNVGTDGSICSIILNGSKAIVIGTGKKSYSEKIIDYIARLKLTDIYLLLPSSSEECMGGAAPFIETYHTIIRDVIFPIFSDGSPHCTELIHAMNEHDLLVQVPHENETYSFGGYTAQFWYPYGQNPASQSQAYMYCRLSGSNTACFIAAGKTFNLSSSPLASVANNFQSTVLIKVDGAAADPSLLDAVSGRYICFSNSKDHSDLLSLYHQNNYTAMSPIDDGTYILSISDDIVTVRSNLMDIAVEDYFMHEPTSDAADPDSQKIVIYDNHYYHINSGCYHITAGTLREMTKENADNEGYRACSYCVPRS